MADLLDFAGPFALGSAGHATVQVGLSQDIPFRLENVEPMKHFDVVWEWDRCSTRG